MMSTDDSTDGARPPEVSQASEPYADALAGEVRRIALVRRPAGALSSCELLHQSRSPVVLEEALEEHAGYVAALERLGLAVVELEPLPEHPDAAFVEDCAVVLDEVAVIPIPGAPSRRGEVTSIRAALEPHRRCVDMLPPTTLDGGDVLSADDTLFVGWSTRTNHAGLRALAHLVLEEGLRVKAVEVRGALHLKTAASDLGEGRLLVDPRMLNLERIRELELVEVPASEPQGANVLRVGQDVILSDSAPQTAELLTRHGLRVHPLPLTSFERMEAGPTCLSIVFESARGDLVPR